MVEFGLDDEGGIDDRVRIQLGEQEIRIVETYEVSHRIMTQPAAFAIRIGNVNATREFMQRFPPNTLFRLYIGSILQQSVGRA
jgi:hypothetical protein